jgi:ribonucleoside-diphosphate reductase alpha chain
MAESLKAAISRHIWDVKYRYRAGDQVFDATIEDTWRRVASALAKAESRDATHWEQSFYGALEGFRFLPGGRILAGAGTGHRVTLFNCFVMGAIEDSMDGIFDALKEGALTLQQGGGVGYDFSTLRPRGSAAKSVGTIASGPVSFMQIWDSMCATLLSTGARRGAMMATLRCDHPDIEDFIAAKRDSRSLRHFNLSVLVTDEFMTAVEGDHEWPLVFPVDGLDDEAHTGSAVLTRRWSGEARAVPCRVLRTVSARELWRKIMRATYDYAEPGVLFIDRINARNNLYYREHISATNPCGEIPLPPYGACDLGSVNLVQFVAQPFSDGARFDFDSLRDIVRIAVRMLDNVIDVSRYPLERQATEAHGSRRIGLGITGLADAMCMLGMRYGEADSLRYAADVVREACHTAYRTSIALAREKGAFPHFETEAYLQGEFVAALPQDIREGIARDGIRNSHLMAIAPTGTVSLLANNVSSGLEPVFDFEYKRRVLELDGSYTEYPLSDYAWRLRQENGEPRQINDAFVDARSIGPEVHLDMQAAVQPFIDSAISKTINVPEDFEFSAFENLYRYAYDRGLKGCTTFRPNPVTGAILQQQGKHAPPPSHCCDLEREAD